MADTCFRFSRLSISLLSSDMLSLDIVLNVNEQAEPPATLLWLPGGAGSSGDPKGNGFFRVIGVHGFEPGKPLLIPLSIGNILSSLDLLSFPLQLGKQIVQAGGCRDQPVDGDFQFSIVASAVLCGLMLNVALALVTAMDDDGQAVFSTQPVIGPEHLVVVTFIGMVMLVVGETDRIENQILVNMSLVNMRAKYKLILATQYFFCQLHPDFMSFLSGIHSMLKGLDLVALVEQFRQSLELENTLATLLSAEGEA